MNIAAAATAGATPTTSVKKMAKYTPTIVVVRLKPVSPIP
jgi:hypothetical protein